MSFEPIEPSDHVVYRSVEADHDCYALSVGFGLRDHRSLPCDCERSVFGFVQQGPTVIRDTAAGSFTLESGMYFATPKGVEVEGGNGLLIVFEGYRAMFTIGGPIEEEGRLRYIDGCSDSLLIPPVRLGDPCLNHLHFPPEIRQTPHTHPSVRLGIVARGRGDCVTPEMRVPLVPGRLWCIPAGELHHFESFDQPLDVIAFHPDSDFGPQDEDHPMINRTLLDGVSAGRRPASS